MMLWLALVVGCAKNAQRSIFRPEFIEPTELVDLSSHSDADVRGDAMVALIDGSLEGPRAEWAARAIADKSLSVRSKAVERLLEHRELELLQQLSPEYSDADLLLCTVALRRFWIDGSHNSFEWPLISKQDAEARMICALAAAEILGVVDPLDQLAQRGDVPYSKPLLALLVHTNSATGALLLPHLDWLEPDYAQQLSAAISVGSQSAAPALSGLQQEECWDLIDVLESVDEFRRKALLLLLSKRSDTCGEAAQLLANGSARAALSLLKKSDDPDVLAVAVKHLDRLARADQLSSRQKLHRVSLLIEKSGSSINEIRQVAIRGLANCEGQQASRHLLRLHRAGEEFLLSLRIELQRSLLVQQRTFESTRKRNEEAN